MSASYAHCLRPGTPVSTVDGGISGVIEGVASLGSPAVGHTYIVRLDHRTSAVWNDYPYKCASIPRSQLRIHGTENIVAIYEGEVQFYEENDKTLTMAEAVNVSRKLYEPYTLQFSFKDEEHDEYAIIVSMKSGVWSGEFDMTEEGTHRPLYHGTMYHVVMEDRQGTLILNATMDDAGIPQHITLRAKCVGEKSEIEEE